VLPTLISGEAAVNLRFEESAAKAGLTFRLQNGQTGQRHQIETMVGGLAALDYDRDGRIDLFFVNGAPIPSLQKAPGFENRLYHNEGNGRFQDVTKQAGLSGEGYGMGAAVGDYDNDGFPDLYVAGVNSNHLYHNRGNGTFEDLTAKSGANGIAAGEHKHWAVGAGFFDYDNDGDLDLFVLQYVDWQLETEPACVSNGHRAYCHPNSYRPLPNLLYRNNGDGTFTDVSQASGIGKFPGKGMGVAFADFDNDGRTDIFVSNDTFRNFLFRNKGDGTFAESAVLLGVAFNEHGKSMAGMGVDFRDADNDGRPDIVQTGMVGDMFPLYHNTGSGFEDQTSAAGLARLTARLTAWGVGLCDFDNDGWKDLFTANGSILDNAREVENLPDRLPLKLFRNQAGKFTDSQALGLADARIHRGAAFADFDGDGRLDIAVSALNDAPRLLLNRTTGAGNWLLLDLEGTRDNRDGLGAVVTVTAAGRKLTNHATTSVGYLSASDRRVHFGLGSATRADRIEIRWPSGARQTLEDVPADQVLKVKQQP
jgi:hypothetical protein